MKVSINRGRTGLSVKPPPPPPQTSILSPCCWCTARLCCPRCSPMQAAAGAGQGWHIVTKVPTARTQRRAHAQVAQITGTTTGTLKLTGDSEEAKKQVCWPKSLCLKISGLQTAGSALPAHLPDAMSVQFSRRCSSAGGGGCCEPVCQVTAAASAARWCTGVSHGAGQRRSDPGTHHL